MSIAQIITGGFGSFGSVPAVILDGFSPGAPAPATTTGGHWAPPKKKRGKRDWERERKARDRVRNQLVSVMQQFGYLPAPVAEVLEQVSEKPLTDSVPQVIAALDLRRISDSLALFEQNLAAAIARAQEEQDDEDLLLLS